MSRVVIISGTTCVGKTEKSLELAEVLGAEIISCDSVQVYEGMDIGSAKVVEEERSRVPHHMIDVCPIYKQYSVGEYITGAKVIFDNIRSRGKNVIVVGGSGFYLKSWFKAVTDGIDILPQAEKEVEEIFLSGGDRALANKLLELDRDAGDFLDIKNPRRVRPTLLRVMSSGKTVGELREDYEKRGCPMGNFEKEYISLERDKFELIERVRIRTKDMLRLGLIDEVKDLLDKGIEKNSSARNAVGYRETINAIKSNRFRDLEENIFISTMQLIRKQKKFLKTQIF